MASRAFVLPGGAAASSRAATQVGQWRVTGTDEFVDVKVPDNVIVAGRLQMGAVVSAHIATLPCVGRRTRSTGAATCRWRRESSSTFRRIPDHLRVRAPLRFVVLTVVCGNALGVAVARRFVAVFFAVAVAVAFLTAGFFAAPLRTVPRAPGATVFAAGFATTRLAALAPLPATRVRRVVVAAGRSVPTGALRGARVPTVRRGEREGLRPALSSTSPIASSSVSESTLSRSGNVAFVAPWS